MYFIKFNNRVSIDLGVGIVSRPNIPAPQKNLKVVTIEGRDGDLYENTGGYKDITIKVDMNFLKEVSIKEQFRKIKNWLVNVTDSKLIFSDDLHWFYKVKKVTMADLETQYNLLGKFSVEFVCSAYSYRLDGLTPILLNNNSLTIVNEYYKALPTFEIQGNGEVTININDKITKVNVDDKVVVDSTLELSYRNKDDYFNVETGEYPILENGLNKIQITGSTTSVKLFPNWRTI